MSFLQGPLSPTGLASFSLPGVTGCSWLTWFISRPRPVVRDVPRLILVRTNTASLRDSWVLQTL